MVIASGITSERSQKAHGDNNRCHSPNAYDDEKDEGEPIGLADDWELMPEVRAARDQGGIKGRKLGVTWKDLTVKGVGADAAINENFGSQFNVAQKIRETRGAMPLRTILEGSHGCVKPGESRDVLPELSSDSVLVLQEHARRTG